MYSRAEPKRSEFFQALEQRAIARTGQIAKGVSNKRLEARNAGVQQLFQPIDGVVAKQSMNTKVHIGRLCGLELEPKRFERPRGRIGVGHFKHGRHTTAGCGGRAGFPGFLTRVTRIAKMNMTVDRTRQHVQPIGSHFMPRRRHHIVVPDCYDLFAIDSH